MLITVLLVDLSIFLGRSQETLLARYDVLRCKNKFETVGIGETSRNRTWIAFGYQQWNFCCHNEIAKNCETFVVCGYSVMTV